MYTCTCTHICTHAHTQIYVHTYAHMSSRVSTPYHHMYLPNITTCTYPISPHVPTTYHHMYLPHHHITSPPPTTPPHTFTHYTFTHIHTLGDGGSNIVTSHPLPPQHTQTPLQMSTMKGVSELGNPLAPREPTETSKMAYWLKSETTPTSTSTSHLLHQESLPPHLTPFPPPHPLTLLLLLCNVGCLVSMCPLLISVPLVTSINIYKLNLSKSKSHEPISHELPPSLHVYTLFIAHLNPDLC